MRYLPAAPLLAAAVAGRPRHQAEGCRYCQRNNPDVASICVSVTDLAEQFRVDPVTIRNWQRGTSIPLYHAEKYATALGLIDYEVWPELLDEQVAEVTRSCPTCGDVFVLTRSDKKFCSGPCRDRSPQALARRRKWQAARRAAETPEERQRRLEQVRAYKEASKRATKAERRRRYERNADAERAYSANYRKRSAA